MTDHDIEKILHRAAELQGARTELLGAPAPEAEDDRRLAFVAEAAVEAGISREDFALATAEVTGSPQQKPVDRVAADRARRWLGLPDRSVSLETRVKAAPAEVLSALQAVLAGPEYQVSVANVVGENPLADGFLVLEPADLWQVSLGQYSKFRYMMGTADFRQVLISLRPDPTAEGHTVVRFHAALDHAAWLNHVVGLGLAWGFAALGAGVAGTLVSLGSGPVWGVAAALGLGAGVYYGAKAGMGALYRWAVRWGQKGLRELAARVGQTSRLKGL